MNLENPAPRKLLFYGDVDQMSIAELTHMILEIDDHDKKLSHTAILHGFSYTPEPINIYINSFGGDAYAVLGLLSIMKLCNIQIHTYVTGCAMSAGFMIAINGHKRFCYETSTLMVHESSHGDSGTIHERLESMEEDHRLQKMLDNNIIENTNLTKKDLKKIYKLKKDKYLSPDDSITYGCIDVILGR